MSETNNNQELERKKLLYESCKSMYDEERNRFLRTDEKASKYLSVLTLLLGAVTFFANWLLTHLTRPVLCVEKVLWALGILIFLSILLAWCFIFVGVLKGYRIRKMGPTNDFMNFFTDNDLINIYESLAWRYKWDYEANFIITQIKSKYLGRGHLGLVFSVVLLIIFLILFALYKFERPEFILYYAQS